MNFIQFLKIVPRVQVQNNFSDGGSVPSRCYRAAEYALETETASDFKIVTDMIPSNKI